MWAEAEASINEALDMSFEALPVSALSTGCDNLACHNYIFFMYIHCLLMQVRLPPSFVELLLLPSLTSARRANMSPSSC